MKGEQGMSRISVEFADDDPPQVPYFVFGETLVMALCHLYSFTRFTQILLNLTNRRDGDFLRIAVTPCFVLHFLNWWLVVLAGLFGNLVLLNSWWPVPILHGNEMFFCTVFEKCFAYGSLLTALFVNMDRLCILATPSGFKTARGLTVVGCMLLSLLVCWSCFFTLSYYNWMDRESACNVFGCVEWKFAKGIESVFKLVIGIFYVISATLLLFLLRKCVGDNGVMTGRRNSLGEYLTLFTTGSTLLLGYLPYLAVFVDDTYFESTVSQTVGSIPRLAVGLNGALCAWIFHHKLVPLTSTTAVVPTNYNY